MTDMTKFFTSLVMTAVLLLPTVTSAATASQVLRQNIEKALIAGNWNGNFNLDKTPSAVTIKVGIDATEKFVAKGKAPNTGRGEMLMSIYNYPISETERDGYFLFDVPVAGGTFGGEKKQFEHPFGFEIKAFHNEILYFRVTNLTDEIKLGLKEFGVDVEPLLNKWIKVDLREQATKLGLDLDDESVKEFFTPEAQTELEVRVKKWFLATQKKLGSPLIITNSQKIKKMKNGDRVQIVSVKFNSKWYNPIAAFGLEEYKHMHPDATKRELDMFKKEGASALKELRAVLDKITTQVTLNLTAGTIPSLTSKYTHNETTYDYTYKYVKNKLVTTKKPKSKVTITVNTSLTFHSTIGETLEVPESSMSIEEVWDLISPKTATSIPESLTLDSTTTTSVSL